MDMRVESIALLRTATIGVPVAALLFLAYLFTLAGIVMNSGLQPWIAESIMAAIAATIWMGTGLRAGSRTVLSALLLFGIGAVASWVLTLRTVHSVSAYYGLPVFVLACIAGIITGTVMLGHASRRSRLAWGGGAIVITAIGIFQNFWSNPPGDGHRLRDSAGASHRVGVIGVPGGLGFAWIRDSDPMADLEGTTAKAAIEFDPGSGYTDVVLRRVTAEGTLAEAGRRAARGERIRVSEDVARGELPALLRHAPVPLWMDRGTVWEVSRVAPRLP